MAHMEQSSPTLNNWLDRKLAGGLSPALLLLALATLLSFGLHFSNLDAIGDSNRYYTAAVLSMSQSWHNFFFAAAEPGASVTVDKPPLGLWVETAFAALLGVSGFSTSLPNMLAGVLSVPLLYLLVRKHLGSAAGLAAALALAVTPVVFAAGRNNTMDGLLTFTLLLAAWAFIAAVERGRLRFLFLGAFIVGLGFNIKMMQALLPLPAFYALYFFAGRQGWLRKLLHLGLASLLLLVVALAWAVAVDLTPAGARPYIGSSENNTVMELIIGHNGLSRLWGPGWDKAAAGQDGPQAGDGPAVQPGDGQAVQPGNGQAVQPGNGQAVQPGNGQAVQPGDGPAVQPGARFQNEVGIPGLLRFFKAPLAKEISWLLPFALLGIVLGVFAERLRLPLQSGFHKAAVLWGGWLLTCLVFFSLAEFFHAYYMIMLAPALGGCLGLALAALWKLKDRQPLLALLLFLGAASLTVAFQFYLASIFSAAHLWMGLALVALALGAGLLILAAATLAKRRRWASAGYAAGYVFVLLALVVIPLGWSALTVFAARPDVNLPAAYAGNVQQTRPADDRPLAQAPDGALPGNQRPGLPPGGAPRPGLPQGGRPQGGLPQVGLPNQPVQDGSGLPGAGTPGDQVSAEMLAYLQEHTQDVTYLLAAPSSHVGATLVLDTGRPVLYMGGFGGGDPVIDAAGLAELVTQGELRYVLWGGLNNANQQQIFRWLRTNCSLVEQFSAPAAGPAGPDLRGRQGLYECQN
jgi:4-amino-4-deoxy-L-arabinose transferase-like glycosyltransferase